MLRVDNPMQNPNQVTVVATLTAQPGEEEELRALLISMLESTRREDGCLNYDLHVATDNAAHFMFHENWRDQASLDAHQQTAHFALLLRRLPEVCAGAAGISLWRQIG